MEFKLNEDTLTIFLSGRVDSTNATPTEAEIDKIREENAHESLIFDLDKLEYISSAGLRVILKMLKLEHNLKLINASSEVYEVFEMTGFTEMATIEKGYRKISVENCEAIGQGANGKVYRIDPETIVKVYLNDDSLPDIKRERDLARKAFVLGIPTAIPYDIIKTNEGYGSVFELLNSEPLAKLIIKNPIDVDKYTDMSIDLLKQIHSTVVKEGDMPSMRDTITSWTTFMKDYIPEASYTKLESLMDEIPLDYHMMHGDYHVKNVMLQNGEPLLIDMDTICYGSPIYEFASMYNAYIGYGAYFPGNVEKFMGIEADLAKHIWRRSIEKYFNTTDETFLDSVEKKAKLIGYMRIIRRSIRRGFLNDPEKKENVESYLNEFIKLIDEVDTLTI